MDMCRASAAIEKARKAREAKGQTADPRDPQKVVVEEGIHPHPGPTKASTGRITSDRRMFGKLMLIAGIFLDTMWHACAHQIADFAERPHPLLPETASDNSDNQIAGMSWNPCCPDQDHRAHWFPKEDQEKDSEVSESSQAWSVEAMCTCVLWNPQVPQERSQMPSYNRAGTQCTYSPEAHESPEERPLVHLYADLDSLRQIRDMSRNLRKGLALLWGDEA